MTRFPHVQREPLPITDPRWLVSTQQDREPEPPAVTHWMPSFYVDPERRYACGAPAGSRASIHADQATCPDCLDAIVRTKCFAPDPDDLIGLGIACKQKLGADGTHEGLHDWQKVLTSALTDQEREQARDSPSGLLPVRVPGAALRDVDESGEPGGPAESERAAESNVERRVIERWPA
jgi:hypothetical protein